MTEDRPLMHLEIPTTPEGIAVKRAAIHCIEFLAGNGFSMNEIFSVLVSSIWMCGNIAIDAGADEEERHRLSAAIHSLADLLDAASVKRNGGLS